MTAVNLNKCRSCSPATPVPVQACGREVNWQHLLSGRQSTPSPLSCPHFTHTHTCPIGHLETPVWLQAPSDHTSREVRETARLRRSVKPAAGTGAAGYLVRQVGKLHQAGMPSRDRWFTGKRERLPHPSRCIQNLPKGLEKIVQYVTGL